MTRDIYSFIYQWNIVFHGYKNGTQTCTKWTYKLYPVYPGKYKHSPTEGSYIKKHEIKKKRKKKQPGKT